MKTKMNTYVDLVFEHARQNVSPKGVEKVLAVQRRGLHAVPWKPATANVTDTTKEKFISRSRLKCWIQYLVDHQYVRV